MSHIVGTVQTAAVKIGPDFGPATSPNTWANTFNPPAAPTGTKFLILHFTGASLPANNRLEVDLGYGGQTDVFTSVDGTDFWTRPINIYSQAAGVPIRYITNGAATGGVLLDKYGRGERHTKDPDNSDARFNSLSNCDPFLGSATYLEPDYATFWFCHNPPNWENVACITPSNDIRSIVAPSVGMVVHVDFNDQLGFVLSTCTVTLVGADVVVTAGHCMADPANDARSSSIIFGYQTNCDGSRPGSYSPQVVKVKDIMAQRFSDGTSNDYCMLRLKTPVVGITPRPMRTDIPGAPEQVFGIHHPNGAVKKLSVPHPGFANVTSPIGSTFINVSLDVSGGSSGSGLFDMQGRITGVLSAGSACGLGYFPIASILQDIASPPPITRDVMIVFDRSGSMSLPGNSGRTKMQEAAGAASLFVSLVKAGTGNKVGLVSFSTTASSPVDFPLTAVTAATKNTLIGPSPFTTGKIGALVANGSTTIGGGLNAAFAQLPSGSNPRNILLLTDGLQNTPPMADPNDRSPAGVAIDVIGYGTPANLDGALLTAIATNHKGFGGQQGQYVLADTSLKLQKFFALAFGTIFESGLLMDPEFVFPARLQTMPPVPFNVCEEETITVVVGWENPEVQLLVELTTPGGATITAATPGVQASASHTWTFLRVALPINGERDGTWNATVFRPGGGGEFPPPMPEVRFFINIVASGGAVLRRNPGSSQYYTGDTINPVVGLQYLSGGLPPNAKIKVIVSRPNVSVGNLLSQEKLGPATVIDADTIPPRQATLMAIEKRTGNPAVAYTQQTFDLFDDQASTNTFESGGLFGNPLKDLLTAEGNYTFHFLATYGDGCSATRELIWSLHVEPGIDPTQTTVTTYGNTITFIPKDKYGNKIGPGRSDGLPATGAPGTTITGTVVDNGDGSYTVPVKTDPSSGGNPGIIINQPGRKPVIVQEPKKPGKNGCRIWRILCLILLFLMLLFLLLWLLN